MQFLYSLFRTLRPGLYSERRVFPTFNAWMWPLKLKAQRPWPEKRLACCPQQGARPFVSSLRKLRPTKATLSYTYSIQELKWVLFIICESADSSADSHIMKFWQMTDNWFFYRNGYLGKSWCCSFCSSISPWLLCFLNFWHDDLLPKDDVLGVKSAAKKSSNGFIFHYIKTVINVEQTAFILLRPHYFFKSTVYSSSSSKNCWNVLCFLAIN